jgi:hypothetical protein
MIAISQSQGSACHRLYEALCQPVPIGVPWVSAMNTVYVDAEGITNSVQFRNIDLHV